MTYLAPTYCPGTACDPCALAWGPVEWFNGYQFISNPGQPDDGAVDQPATFPGGKPYWGLGFTTDAVPTTPVGSLVNGLYQVGNQWGSPDGNPPYTWGGPTVNIMTYNGATVFDGLFNGAYPPAPPPTINYTQYPVADCIMLGSIGSFSGSKMTCVLPYPGSELDIIFDVLKEPIPAPGNPTQNRYASSFSTGGIPGIVIFVRGSITDWFPGYAAPVPNAANLRRSKPRRRVPLVGRFQQ